MYWNMMGQYDSPQIENLLQREDVTIHDLLDEENIINELIHRNEKLVQFLSRESNIKEMLNFITEDCSYCEISLEDVDEYNKKQLRFKRAHQVTELLNADNESISKNLINSEELVSQLLSMLECEKDLNPLLACFFSKIIGSLMKQHPEETWNILKNRENFIEDIMRHMSTSGISDLVMRLVVCPSYNDQVRSEIIQWMVDEELVEKLISLINLDEGANTDLHAYAANTMNELISILRQENSEAARCPLLNRLTQTSTIDKVIAQMLVEPINSAIVATTGSILSTYLEKVQRITPFAAWIDDPSSDFVSYYPSAAPCVETLANHVPRLKNILHNPPEEPAVSLPHCRLEQPLGRVRLQIVRLISESIPQNVQSFFNALKDEKLLDKILSLFIEYDNNSFLSGYFRDILVHVLEADYTNTDFFNHLIKDCQLLERLTEAWDQSIDQEHQGLPRKGYMGHLYLILKLLFEVVEDEGEEEEQKSKHQEERQKQIQEHLLTLSEEKRRKWNDVKNNIKEMKELQAKDLGRSRRAASPPPAEPAQPSPNAEDQFARYQINAEFDYKDDYQNDFKESFQPPYHQDQHEEDTPEKEESFEKQNEDKASDNDWFAQEDHKPKPEGHYTDGMDTNADPWGQTSDVASEKAEGFANFANFDNQFRPHACSSPSDTTADPPSDPPSDSMEIETHPKLVSVEEEDFCGNTRTSTDEPIREPPADDLCENTQTSMSTADPSVEPIGSPSSVGSSSSGSPTNIYADD